MTFYMNLWQGSSGNQWIDPPTITCTRAIANAVAADVEGMDIGIRRIAIIRVTPKQEAV